MAYSVAWNESTPVGAATLASDIDLEIRNLKVSISERMSQLVDWDTDATDPKVLLNAALPAGGSWNTGGNDLEIADGLGWGGGAVIASSDDVVQQTALTALSDSVDTRFAEVDEAFLTARISDVTGFRSGLSIIGSGTEIPLHYCWQEGDTITASSSETWVALRPGELVGIWATLGDTRTGGTLTLGITKNFSPLATITLVLDGTNSAYNRKLVALESGIAFVAGDRLGMYYTTSGFTPTTNTLFAGFQVIYDS